MTRDVNILKDGFSTLERGMDSGRDASLIGRNQAAFMVNATVRGGFVSNRPGYRKTSLDFGSATTESRFKSGRWQGAKYYDPVSGAPERIACAIGGRFFVFIPDQQDGLSNSVQEITPARSDSWETSMGFVVPAAGATVQIGLVNTSSLQLGQVIVIETFRFEVISVDNFFQTTVENIDGTEGASIASSTTVTSDGHSDVNNSRRWQVWMEQAEDFLIIQDGQAKPVIYNGSEARRAADDEVPTGTVMAYGLGRLWVARGREFIASDIVGGPSGTALYNKRDAILHFTENDYLNEGGAFLAPEQITGMAFPSNLNKALGEGELTVFMRTGAVTVNVPASRDDWKNLSIPLQRVSLKPFGATGQENIVEVNQDLWFRAQDGIRSFAVAQRDYGDWGNVPMSREMDAVLQSDDERLTTNTSGVLFDNRLLMTCIGQLDFDHGRYFKALVALDFNPVSGMFERLPPAYDGVWTGINILQVVAGEFHGVMRCFAFVLNGALEIEVWELTRKDIVDRPEPHSETRIVWQVTPRAFGFEDNGDGLKKLCSGALWGEQFRGDVRICVEYRPDQYPIWQEWGCWNKRASKQWCAGNDCLPRIPLPQYRTKMRLPRLLQPPDEVSDGKPMNHGYEFQTRIIVTGSWGIRRMRVKAEIVQEEQDSGCPETDEAEVLLVGCPDYFLDYDSTDSGQVITTEDGDPITTEGGDPITLIT